MDRVFTVKGLDCPHCSAEIERDVSKLKGVKSASVNLISQTLTVQEKSYSDDLYRQVKMIVNSHEPEVEVFEKNAKLPVRTVFSLDGLDCPNCAVEIETAVSEHEAVITADVNLVGQTLTVVSKDISSDKLLKIITKIVHSHEPEVKVSVKEASGSAKTYDKSLRLPLIRIITGACIYAVTLICSQILSYRYINYIHIGYIIAYAVMGFDIVWKALRNIVKGRLFDENFLMTISTLGAFAIGEYPEAVAVMLFYQVGELFQSYAVNRSGKSITSLLDIRSDKATVLRNGSLVTVDPEEVSVGEIITVKSGERIPLDGIITEGSSTLDTKALTGEAMPRSVSTGDEVLSGCINEGGVLNIRVTGTFRESTASKIIEMVENAASRKAPSERFITRFARWYTPMVVIAALLIAFIPPFVLQAGWEEWLRRGFVFLVISCPCALVISIPLTFSAV